MSSDCFQVAVMKVRQGHDQIWLASSGERMDAYAGSIYRQKGCVFFNNLCSLIACLSICSTLMRTHASFQYSIIEGQNVRQAYLASSSHFGSKLCSFICSSLIVEYIEHSVFRKTFLKFLSAPFQLRVLLLVFSLSFQSSSVQCVTCHCRIIVCAVSFVTTGFFSVLCSCKSKILKVLSFQGSCMDYMCSKYSACRLEDGRKGFTLRN